jgi:hypothetical protein
MKRFLGGALPVLFVSLAACGGEVTGPDAGQDGATADVSDAMMADVTLPDGFDFLNCGDLGQTYGGPCNASVEQECEKWTQDRAYGAYGHGRCQNDPSNTSSVCTLGDYCLTGEPCRCSAILVCAPGQVCYSDTPDGSTHCKPACTPSP